MINYRKNFKLFLYISICTSMYMDFDPSLTNINLPLDTIEALAWEVI